MKNPLRNLLDFFRKYYLILVSITMYIGIKCCHFEFVPDFISIHSINPSGYFELILNCTASILGILITVILLTFEFVKHASFRREGANIFDKPVVTRLISLALSIIVLSLISYSYIQNFEESHNITIGYFISFLFLSFIVSIFPAAKEILETANTLKNTKAEIDSLTIAQFKEILTLKDDKFISKNNSLVIVRIRHELLKSVSECDYEAYAAILAALNKKAIELIGKGKNRETTRIVFHGTSFIWNSGNFEALRVGNYQYYETLWECIEELYEYAAKEKIFLLHYEEIDYFIRDFINFLSRNKLGSVLSSSSQVLMEIFKQHLKFNCPPQEEINSLYYAFADGDDFPYVMDSNIQWDKITYFLSIIQDIQRYAVDGGDTELFYTCRMELEHLIREINYSDFPEVKIYQEAAIVIDIISHQTYFGRLADESMLFKDFMRAYHIDASLIADLIKKQKFYVKRILPDIGDYLILSQRKETLDEYVSLNYWGAIGRHISPEYLKNNTAKESMEYLIDVLSQLKTEIEKNQLPKQFKNYNEVKDQLDSIKRCLLKDNKGQEIPILNKIEGLLNSFKEVTGIVSDFRIVKWTEGE